jgi:hypothetical protein
MAFDSARGRTVLFGGIVGGSATHDTWEWDGNFWTQIQDIGPPARSLTTLAFDSTRGRTVLFGGEGNAGALLGDTWEWDGSEWMQLQDIGPSARSAHSTAFDSNQQRLVLFGGRAGTGLCGDTWQWDGTAWTQFDDTGPSARASHATVYAADRNRTVLLGGDGGSGTALSDTWEWDGTHWTQQQDIGSAREGLAMAFTGGSTIMFGGSSGAQDNAGAALFGDTWGWDGQHWVERQDMGPQARWMHAVAYDATRSRLVLFGGATTLARDSQLGDTWEAVDSGTNAAGVVLTTLELTHVAGQGIGGIVGLSGPAPPPGGVVVQLSAGLPPPVNLITQDGQGLAGPPWPVPIAAGTNSTQFQTAGPIDNQGVITFTATLDAVTKTASVDTSTG